MPTIPENCLKKKREKSILHFILQSHTFPDVLSHCCETNDTFFRILQNNSSFVLQASTATLNNRLDRNQVKTQQKQLCVPRAMGENKISSNILKTVSSRVLPMTIFSMSGGSLLQMTNTANEKKQIPNISSCSQLRQQ